MRRAPHEGQNEVSAETNLYPSYVVAKTRAACLHATGDPRAAADAFRAAAQQHRSAPAWINLASTLLELGDAPGALAAAREAVALGDVRWQALAETVQAQAQALHLGASSASPDVR